MSATSLAFKIVYNALYYFLYLVLLAFLIVTPADLIHQALQHHQGYIILVIALCYLVTIIFVAFIYAARLYISRSVLASIPKQWIPVEKGDMPRMVRALVAEYLSRSAAITYEARPRIPPVTAPGNAEQGDEEEGHAPQPGAQGLQIHRIAQKGPEDGAITITIPKHKAPWGEIEHPGWASPLSPDLPDLQYNSVISELPNLIEAKALTLAPEDPESSPSQPMLDAEAVGLLQRADNMGLRDYLAHLAELGVMEPSPTIADFITKYEYARFSARPLSNDRFRDLMHLFAEVLRAMGPMDPAVLDPQAEGDDDNDSLRAPSYDTDIDNDAPMRTNPSTPGSRRSLRRRRSGGSLGIARKGSTSTTNSRLQRPGLVARNSSANTWQFRTAPTTPKSRRTAISRSSSTNSFAQTRHPYPASEGSSPSVRSLSGGSVIRLADTRDDTDLPYVLRHPRTQ
ncbi:hypothetical protein GQ53DRAFT_741901 [Thozetella sp. PMI_491]|nr:hypothetical protein GQ53DRAFT_741901 [Thozetella sp. PMI_491]